MDQLFAEGVFAPLHLDMFHHIFHLSIWDPPKKIKIKNK